MLKRKLYLEKIRPYYDTDDIKILVGIRRAGKSTLLYQIREELQKKENANIVSFDFEDFETSLVSGSPEIFYHMLLERLRPGCQNYLLIDEIQYLKDYEKILASARASLHYSIFVTGSTSSLLKGKLGSRLTGRAVEFQVFPFSFKEFSEYTGKSGKEAFDEYLIKGGMPSRLDSPVKDDGYLKRLYEAILERDILSDRSVSSKNVFLNIASYLLARTGEIYSALSVSKEMAKNHISDVSYHTVDTYVSYLEEAFLLKRCDRYSIKGKAVLSSYGKYYAVDTGLAALQTPSGNLNLGFLAETVIHNELLSRGYEVYVGKTFQGEIDFVARKGTELSYYQVAYLLNNNETTIEREFGAFSSIRDNWPKYVLSLDNFDYSRDGIRHMNLLDFLLN